MCRPSSLNTRRLALRRSDLSSLREVPAFPSLLPVLPRCEKGGGVSNLHSCCVDLGATMLFLHAVRDSVVLWEVIHSFVCLFYKTEFLYVVLTVLEFILQNRLALNLERSLTQPSECCNQRRVPTCLVNWTNS